MDYMTVVKKVCAQVMRQARENLTPATELRQDLGVDSMDATDIAMLLEEETGTALPDSDLKSVRTLGDLAALLEKRVGLTV